jgi:hypothetical protein
MPSGWVGLPQVVGIAVSGCVVLSPGCLEALSLGLSLDSPCRPKGVLKVNNLLGIEGA